MQKYLDEKVYDILLQILHIKLCLHESIDQIKLFVHKNPSDSISIFRLINTKGLLPRLGLTFTSILILKLFFSDKFLRLCILDTNTIFQLHRINKHQIIVPE